MNRNMYYRPNAGSGSLGTYRNLEHTRGALQQRGGKPQQKMAPNNKPLNRKRQYGNEHSSQNYVTYDTNQGGTQNFAYLYDDGPGPSYDRGHGPNKKRQKINVWDIDVFGSNQNTGNQRNTPYRGRQSPPRPLMSLPGPAKIRRLPNAPPKTHKNFSPNKVNKSFKSKPNQPIKSPTQTLKEEYILRADRVPSQHVVGRLELALGSILKEMKASLCTSTETFSVFTSKVIQRSIKQTIRERIKTVMLNKHVGKYIEIIAAYRKRFPENTDKDVLDMAVIKTGASEQHIKQNFGKILTRKVNAMFRKLQVLIDEKEMEVEKLIEARQLFKDDKKTEEDIKQSVKIESDFYSSVVDSLLGARLPKILPNYAACIVKMLKREGHLNQINGDDADNDDSGPIELPDSETDEDVVEVEQDAGEEINTETVANTELNEPIQDEEMIETNVEESLKDVSHEQNENAKENDNIKKESIKEESQTTTTSIENNVTKTEPNDGKTNNTELEKSSKEISSPASQTYLVKVLCQPELPSKAEAYKFLMKFNMASVKKHKVIHNLLVVGFNTEKDYNDVLAASGTVIENSTLIIKGNKSQQTSVPAASNSEVETKEEASSKDNSLLTSSLENQITDLLSSIREEKEKNDANDATEKEDEMTNQDENPEENTNLYSPSNPYDNENELDTIKEIEESKVDESEPAQESETTEVDKSVAEDDKNTVEDNDGTPAENIDTETADIDKTSAEIDKPAENVDTAPKTNKDAKGTPIRASSRLAATPSNVRTRRASRLAQNN